MRCARGCDANRSNVRHRPYAIAVLPKFLNSLSLSHTSSLYYPNALNRPSPHNSQGCALSFSLGRRGPRASRRYPRCVLSWFRDWTEIYTQALAGVTEAFKADKDPRKINLGVGAYRVS